MLLDFPKLDDQELWLKEGWGKQLVVKVKNLPSLPLDDITALELLTFIHKQPFEELYPNLWVAL